ncbi:hypothetical protein Asd1617_02373 [Shigella dysenteriae 1617]|uniref:Uncharacterized protein n=1 Tax=Shigella dysenteriae 1617 TaxID=754093 RepID=A0A0A6ZTI4_SHIDY|nr:hypothetical protein Asd1617_02373 [Shigella dysenteriae 1617]
MLMNLQPEGNEKGSSLQGVAGNDSNLLYSVLLF